MINLFLNQNISPDNLDTASLEEADRETLAGVSYHGQYSYIGIGQGQWLGGVMSRCWAPSQLWKNTR